jgi:hypothetical protein
MCNFGSPQPGALTSNLAHKVVGRNNHFTPTRYGHWIQRAERAGPFSPPTLVDPRSPSFSNGRYMTLFLWPLSVATCSPAPSGPHWAFPVSGSSTPPRGFWRRLFRRPRGPLEPCGRALVHAIFRRSYLSSSTAARDCTRCTAACAPGKCGVRARSADARIESTFPEE